MARFLAVGSHVFLIMYNPFSSRLFFCSVCGTQKTSIRLLCHHHSTVPKDFHEASGYNVPPSIKLPYINSTSAEKKRCIISYYRNILLTESWKCFASPRDQVTTAHRGLWRQEGRGGAIKDTDAAGSLRSHPSVDIAQYYCMLSSLMLLLLRVCYRVIGEQDPLFTHAKLTIRHKSIQKGKTAAYKVTYISQK